MVRCIKFLALVSVLVNPLAGLAEDTNNTRQTTEYAHRIKLRMTDALEGCVENNGTEPCREIVALILTGFISRADPVPELRFLDSVFPNALWNTTQNNFRSLYSDHCGAEEITRFQNWVSQLPTGHDIPVVAVLPEPLSVCFSFENPVPPKKRRYFWLFDGQKVIGSIKCSRPDAVPNPQCSVLAYPNHGRFYLQLGYFPLANLNKITTHFPPLVKKLEQHTPDDIPVDWSFLPASEGVIVTKDTQNTIDELIEAQNDKYGFK